MRRVKLPEHLSPVWAPVFNHQPVLEAVADDAREPFAQMASYAALLGRAALEEREASEAMQAMQLCERLHGYAATADAMRYAVRVIDAAVKLIGMSAQAIAERYGCANVGVLTGALIEEWADDQRGLAGARRFPELPWWARRGSPHPLLDDCRLGVRLAWLIDPQHEEAPLACSALVAAARSARGERWAGELAQRMIDAGSPTRAIAEVERAGAPQPPLWLRYAFHRRHTP
jgi:hypothetical protein